MGTIGTRGVLAAAFIASSGLLTGMTSVPAGEGPGIDSSAAREAAVERDGLLERAVHRACVISLAATRSDLRTAAERERECH